MTNLHKHKMAAHDIMLGSEVSTSYDLVRIMQIKLWNQVLLPHFHTKR